jgi:hypothetical protein
MAPSTKAVRAERERGFSRQSPEKHAVSPPLLLSSAYAPSKLPLARLGTQNLASSAQALDYEDA